MRAYAYTSAVTHHWTQIRGQDTARSQLQKAVERDRIYPGQLFVGPRGVGKRMTALAFAQILNCTKRGSRTFGPACGTCSSCRKFQNDLQHPDLHLVEPLGGINKTIKIDQVREVQRHARTRPYEGRWQIVVFDDAHTMTDEAANALLKTLEEPPDSMRLILVTDQVHALLDTIRSRCRTVRFGALPEPVVVELLQEQFPADEHPVAVAARYGEGSVGRATEILESGILDERGEMFDTIADLNRDDTARLLSGAESLAKEKAALAARLELIGVMLRDVLLWQVGIPAHGMVNNDLIDRVAGIGRRISSEALLSRIDAVRVARDLLTRNVHPTLVLENLFTELAPGPARPPVHLPRL